MPSHANYKPTVRRSSAASSSIRIENENQALENQIQAFIASDEIKTLSNLRVKLSSQSAPLEFNFIDSVSGFIFYKVDTVDVPKISKSLKLKDDLSFQLFCGVDEVHYSNYAHISSNKINSFNEIENLLVYLNNYAEPVNNCLEHAIKLLCKC